MSWDFSFFPCDEPSESNPLWDELWVFMFSERQTELNYLPQHLYNPQEADILFVKLLESMKECLDK